MLRLKKSLPVNSPVLVVDALGVSARIANASADELVSLADELDHQFYKFIAKIPNTLVIEFGRRVYGSSEFSSLHLNDMFVLYSEKNQSNMPHRYLVAGLLLYHQLLLSGQIPRGGLGFGDVMHRNGMILGKGFLDAYLSAEQREANTKDVCAIQVSSEFLRNLPSSEYSYRLLCRYNQRFFLNPRSLDDPEMGSFNEQRILDLLEAAGANSAKLSATADFLAHCEDYDAALKLRSQV